jgi:hypothetical protein
VQHHRCLLQAAAVDGGKEGGAAARVDVHAMFIH